MVRVYCGTIVNPTPDRNLEILQNVLIGVDADGLIVFREDETEQAKLEQEYRFNGHDIERLPDGSFLIPGFVDTHIHACQYSNAGLGLDMPLLDWLNTYTFPTEAKFANTKFARHIYTQAVARTLLNGTTTAQYFATIHVPASITLAEVTHQLGQRAFIGKVSMDQQCPSFYSETTENSLQSAETFVQTILAQKNPLVQPVITPRFAVSCSQPLMEGLAQLAKQYDLRIQSHVSENKAEVALVQKLFPGSSSYCDVYHQAGLLSSKTVLAHGVHLTNEELKLLSQHGVHIAHCANSNCSLKSGMCNVRKLLNAGINVGLGTDISGGYSPSILDAIRQTIAVSNLISVQSEDIGAKYPALTYMDAFYLATLGGARALGLETVVGSLEPGKKFDALHINLVTPNSPVDLSTGNLTWEEKVQKFIFLADDRNIERVFVEGTEVKAVALQNLNLPNTNGTYTNGTCQSDE